MRFSVAVAVSCLIATSLSAAENAAAAMKRLTNIPAQALEPALTALAKEHDLQLLYRSELVTDHQTGGASGNLSLEQALTQLLSNTGLTYRFLDDKAITIVPADTVKQSVGTPGPEGRTSDLRSQVSRNGPRYAENRRNSSRDRFRVAQAAEGNASVDSESEPSSGRIALEEIVVNAQKQGDQRLRDVPVPVSVIDAAGLVENGQLLMRDYASTVPGFVVAPNFIGMQGLSLRGIGSVALTIDDVPFLASPTTGGNFPQDVDPGDLARIEVLRGPQGTLYGANNMGGLVRYVTKDPSFGEFEGRIEAGANSIKSADRLGSNLRVSANIPLTESLAMRASGYTRRDAGYVDNPVLGLEDVNDARAQGGSVSAMWRPTDSTSLKLNAIYQKYELDGSAELEEEPNLGDLQQNFLAGTGGYDKGLQSYSAIFNTKIRDVRLTSVTAFMIGDTYSPLDFTYSIGGPNSAIQRIYGTPVASYSIDNRTEKISQEIRISGPLGPRLDWQVGAFYSDEDYEDDEHFWAGNIGTAQVAGDYWHFTARRTFTEYAGFITLTYRFTDRFDVQLGGRGSRTELVNEPTTEAGPYTMAVLGRPSPVINPQTEAQDDAFTYLFTPRFRLSDEIMLYGRFASAFRPGTPNLPIVTAAGLPAQSEAETTDNYEFGLKGEFLGGTLGIDASIYYIDYKDLQIRLRDPASGIGYGFNAGRAKSEGVEISFQSRPVTDLIISGWVAYDNAELTEAFPVTSPTLGAVDDQLPNAPHFSGNLAVEKHFPLWRGASGLVAGAVRYIGDRDGVFVPRTAVRRELPSYTSFDLRARFQYGHWGANLFLNNVTDKRGILAPGNPPNTLHYIQPRMVGLSVSRVF